MEKIKNFLLSLVVPAKMRKHKGMSIIISLLIFILEVYILTAPINVVLKRNLDDKALESSYASVFYQVQDDLGAGVDGIINSNYYIDDELNIVSTIENEGIKVYNYQFEENDKVINVSYVFDVNESTYDAINNVYNDYKELFPDEEDTKAYFACELAYIDALDNDSLDDDVYMTQKYNDYHNLTEEELQTKLSEKEFLVSLFQLDHVENHYVMVLYTSRFMVQIPGDELTMATSNYNTFEKETSKITNINDFSKQLALTLTESEVALDGVTYLEQVLAIVLLAPVLIATLIWIFTRKTGCLQNMKEYYNVAALASIIPGILSFILVWIIGTTALWVYCGLLGLFLLYYLYQVNRDTTAEDDLVKNN